MTDLTDTLQAVAGEESSRYSEIRQMAMLDLVRDPRQVVYQSDALIAKLLEALEERGRCEECDSREETDVPGVFSYYCLLWSINTPDSHYCKSFTPRDREASHD